MMINPIILDDLLPKSYANEIENILLKPFFPWYFVEDVTYDTQLYNLKEEEKSQAFSHSFLLHDITSNYFDLVKIIPHIALQKINTEINFSYLRARTFLQLPVTNPKPNGIHTDDDAPHIVCLYYVNDSDGDTLLFDNKKQNIIKSISPKKNRVVIFDGSIPHCSSEPSKNKRCVINFNITHEYLLS